MAQNRPIDSSSAGSIVQLTNSDSANFATKPRGIIIKTDGIIVYVNDDDTTIQLAAGTLATGIVHPLSPKRINATTTTAVVYGVF